MMKQVPKMIILLSPVSLLKTARRFTPRIHFAGIKIAVLIEFAQNQLLNV